MLAPMLITSPTLSVAAQRGNLYTHRGHKKPPRRINRGDKCL
uniref:Uncharacterized protein n=1 Tax=Anguilla anguilla TaxID=7936 RepID=A0A0E9Q5B7_ANGAN